MSKPEDKLPAYSISSGNYGVVKESASKLPTDRYYSVIKAALEDDFLWGDVGDVMLGLLDIRDKEIDRISSELSRKDAEIQEAWIIILICDLRLTSQAEAWLDRNPERK